MTSDRRSTRPWLAALIVTGGAVAIACLGWSTYAPALAPAAPSGATATGEVALRTPRRVRVDTRIGFDAVFAAQQVSLQLRFDLPAIVEVVLRQTNWWMARYQVLVLSSDTRIPCGFYEANSVEFDASSGNLGYVAPTGAPISIEIRADGPELVATADGREIARSWDAHMLCGTTAVQGVQGEAELLACQVAPRAWPAASTRRSTLLLLLVVAVAVFLALVMSGAEILHRATRIGRGPARRRESLAWLPLIAYAVMLQLESSPHLFHFLAALFLFFLGKGLALVARDARFRWPPFLLGVMHAGAAAYLTGLLIGPRLLEPDVQRANALTHYHWQGRSLQGDLLWYLHPLCRRWNDFLCNREFRSRPATLEKPAGAIRIACLGTSSTYGHGFLATDRADYPAQLADLLAETMPARHIEVLNAAVPGSTGSRLLPFFRDVLTQYALDVLVLNLSFNDAAALGQADERSYYQRIVRADFDNSFWQRLRERFSMRWRQQRYVANRELFGAGRVGDIRRGPGERNAPRVFALMLGDYLRECRARNIRLLLVQEPTRSPVYLVKELHDAMRRFAEDQGVPLLDPAPALERAGGAARFQDEVHPDRAGHAVIAGQLAQMLLEEKLLVAWRALPNH
ncbi:MAG: SGNH/GDSL hydrolase family protein [Planctomycetota bacterium]